MLKIFNLCSVTSLLALLLTASAASANDHTVCADGCDFTTIQDAIDAAMPGDTIELTPQVLQDSVHTEAGIRVTKNVTIKGQGQEQTIVQASEVSPISDQPGLGGIRGLRMGVARDRVFIVEAGVSVTIRDLTVRHGHPVQEYIRTVRKPEKFLDSPNMDGGGILNRGRLTLFQVTVSANRTFEGEGGGVATLNGATLILQDSRIAGNEAPLRDGGGLSNRGTLRIVSSAIVENKAPLGAGGGIDNWSGDVSITASSIAQNSARSGGGLSSSGVGVVTIVDSDFNENVARSKGGGVLGLVNSDFNINHTTFKLNRADFGGGAYFNVQVANVSIVNSTFDQNRAASGAGMTSLASSAVVRSSTFSRNRFSRNHQRAAGGIDHLTGDLLVSNSTVSGNDGIGIFASGIEEIIVHSPPKLEVVNSTIAFQERGIVRGSGSVQISNSIVAMNGVDCSGSINKRGPNLDGDGTCGFSITGNADLQLLANNGGPTETHALGEDSEAIDAGDDGICQAPPIAGEDQRGVERPQGPHCDLGAYETERPEDEEDEVAVTVQVTGSGSGSVVDSELGINIDHSGDGDSEQTVLASPGTEYSLKITANEGSQIEGAEPCEEEPVNFIQEFECDGTIDGDGIFVIRFDFATIPEPDPEPEPEIVAIIDQTSCADGDSPSFEKLRYLRGVLLALARAFDEFSNVIQCVIRVDVGAGEDPTQVQQTGDVGEFGIVDFILELGLFQPGTAFTHIREKLLDGSAVEVLGRFLNDVFVPFLWQGLSFNPTVESFDKIAANDPYFVIQAQFQAEGPGLITADIAVDPALLAVVFQAGDSVGGGFAFDSFHAGAVPGIALNPLGDGAVVTDVVDTTSGAVVDGLLTFRADTPGANLLLRQGQATEFPGVFISRLVNVAMDGDGVIAVLGRVSGTGITSVNDETVWVCIAALCNILVQEGMEPDGMPGVRLRFPGSPIVRGGKLMMRTVLEGTGIDSSNNFGLLLVDLVTGAVELVGQKGEAFGGDTIADFTSKAFSNNVPLVTVRLNGGFGRALARVEAGGLVPEIVPGDEFTLPDGTVGIVSGIIDITETGGEDGRASAVGGGGYAIVVSFEDGRSGIVACTAACLEGG